MGRKQAAITLAVILSGLTVFQLMLAFGYPLGKAAWGGVYTTLPASLRIASLLSAAFYIAVIAIALYRAGMLGTRLPPRLTGALLWVLTALFALSTAMNLASQSFWERTIMTPLALILTLCCYRLARTEQARCETR